MTQLFFVAAMFLLSGSAVTIREARAFSSALSRQQQRPRLLDSHGGSPSSAYHTAVSPSASSAGSSFCRSQSQRRRRRRRPEFSSTTALSATDSRRLRFYGGANADANANANGDALLDMSAFHSAARSISSEAARACAEHLARAPGLIRTHKAQEQGSDNSRSRSDIAVATASPSGAAAATASLSSTHAFFQSFKPRAPATLVAETTYVTGRTFSSSASSYSSSSSSSSSNSNFQPKRTYGPYIFLTQEEKDLFSLLRRAREETELSTTLRVAGGWVRDKLLATTEFKRTSTGTPALERLTSKFKPSAPSMGRQGTKVIANEESDPQPVDIDIALDDLVGREFADCLNEYLSRVGQDTVSVGVVLKNPEKSKHLETATMKVGTFWIDFVNLRAEEYTQNSRIPDLMRIGTPAEDAFRRDLTINALFYNINNGQIEDWTGRGLNDLRRGIVATPLAPLTTLLDDPLRVLRSVRFAARLQFRMDDELVDAAMDTRVHRALAEKVSRERVGGEVDLMLRSPDPVGAMHLLIDLKLVNTVFPMKNCLDGHPSCDQVFEKGLTLMSTAFSHMSECRVHLPVWCESKKEYTTHGVDELTLMQDENARRLLWYSAFLKPLLNYANRLPKANTGDKPQSKKSHRSIIARLLLEELKRPARDVEAIEKIMRAADEFTMLLNSGCDLSATSVLLSDIRVYELSEKLDDGPKIGCSMNGRRIDSATEDDPVWEHAMEFRLLSSEVVKRIGPLWRAALVLSLSEQLVLAVNESGQSQEVQEDLMNSEIERFDAFAAAMQRLGVVGIWNEKPLLDGKQIKRILPKIPKGPAFRDVMDEQERWMILHPGTSAQPLTAHLEEKFPEFR